MPATRIIPEDRDLRRLVEQGLTHQEIADLVYEQTGQRVTRGAVSSAVSRAGISRTTNRYKDHLPWRVRIQHSKHYAARMLRLLGRRDAGEELHPADADRLDAWLAKINEEKAVVVYMPESEDGFHYMDPPPGFRRRKIPIFPQTVHRDDLIRWERERAVPEVRRGEGVA